MVSSSVPVVNFDDQMELKTMVDAIAAASQREAKAHESAIVLSKENDELRLKIKVLIEDNNKLIELYEQATSERSNYVQENTANGVPDEGPENHGDGAFRETYQPNETENEKVVKNLENQLMEMHEENEKLMSLYEKAMQERDEFKRMLHTSGPAVAEAKDGYDCPEKLVEVDAGDTDPEIEGCLESDDIPCKVDASISMEETAEVMKPLLFTESDLLKEGSGTFKFSARMDSQKHSEDDRAHSGHLETKTSSNFSSSPDEIALAKMNLEDAELKLKDYARNAAAFASVEKAVNEVDEIYRQIEEIREIVKVKQHEIGVLGTIRSEEQENADVAWKKFSALKHTILSFSESLEYFEQREARAKGRVNASVSYLNQKKNELSHLEARKDELVAALMKNQQSEEETKKILASLKSKLEEDRRKQESENALFPIDNAENVDPSSKTWTLCGKASDLLKLEEEKIKLQTDIRLCQERLGGIRKELVEVKQKLGKTDAMVEAVQGEITKGSRAADELEIALQVVMQEKNGVLEMMENGRHETQDVLLSYHHHVFEADLKAEEMEVLGEELKLQLQRIEELEEARAEKKTQLLEEMQSYTSKSGKIEELLSAAATIEEARSLLSSDRL